MSLELRLEIVPLRSILEYIFPNAHLGHAALEIKSDIGYLDMEFEDESNSFNLTFHTDIHGYIICRQVCGDLSNWHFINIMDKSASTPYYSRMTDIMRVYDFRGRQLFGTDSHEAVIDDFIKINQRQKKSAM